MSTDYDSWPLSKLDAEIKRLRAIDDAQQAVHDAAHPNDYPEDEGEDCPRCPTDDRLYSALMSKARRASKPNYARLANRANRLLDHEDGEGGRVTWARGQETFTVTQGRTTRDMTYDELEDWADELAEDIREARS